MGGAPGDGRGRRRAPGPAELRWALTSLSANQTLKRSGGLPGSCSLFTGTPGGSQLTLPGRVRVAPARREPGSVHSPGLPDPAPARSSPADPGPAHPAPATPSTRGQAPARPFFLRTQGDGNRRAGFLRHHQGPSPSSGTAGVAAPPAAWCSWAAAARCPCPSRLRRLQLYLDRPSIAARPEDCSEEAAAGGGSPGAPHPGHPSSLPRTPPGAGGRPLRVERSRSPGSGAPPNRVWGRGHRLS